MSFILDALRKSESSRLRQDQPAIFAVRGAAARPGLPGWALVLVALLLINLLVVGYALWRDDSGATREADRPTVSSATAPMAATATSPSATAVAPSSASTRGIDSPRTDSPRIDSPRTDSPRTDSPRGAARAANTVTRSADSSPAAITRDDLLARGANVPPAELNMHVYDAEPRARFVLLNGQRLREGETSREGLVLERITAAGVVLRYGTASFAVNLQ
ncbi:MAG: general secretion pathway protein GspB [Gammaproteobacteria bacterium]|nr:general secretion pathway protein GspB [Gammaproteobacteria bacterium]